MTVEAGELRRAMRHWSSGVTIVAAHSRGVSHGMTVSSFTSVSLEPPTITISLERNSRTYGLVVEAGSFGITLLNSQQQRISEIFSGNESENSDRFSGLVTWTLETGAPFLADGLAYLDCRVVTTLDFGDNALIIGEVIAVKVGEDGKPLVYHDRQYRELQD